ncbi:zeta toxin-domain-containing protein [Podospora appendiculata]|uniref:Zeta toxin-domain-containing protein n=1 Tax=Podospora appendiculata TaxID=314037 RepID=A0AAE1CFI6_9PEZI|nr:zeta toxin-domain-containing protein [Podospora appendiculata]
MATTITTTTALPPSWTLTPSARESIFHDSIAPHEVLPHLLHRPQPPTTQPLAVLLVGQTGAGKTRLAPALADAIAARRAGHHPPAHFIADTYKTYHPHYQACLTSHPQHASALAGLDARVWLSMACALAAEHRLDALVESACRHPDDFARLAEVFHSAGYRVRVAVLAVPPPLSRLGILVRFFANLPEAQSRGLPLRLTPKRVHDESFAGLGPAARFIDDGGAVDGVVVVRRGNLRVYANERRPGGGGGGGWVGEGRVVDVLERERRRGLSAEERAMARRDVEALRALGDEKVDELVGEVEGLLEGVGEDEDEDEGLGLEPLDAEGFVWGGVE